MITSFTSFINVSLVDGLSKILKASAPIAVPPSVPEDSITIPDSSKVISGSAN